MFSTSAMKRVIRSQSDKRVSKDSAKLLNSELEGRAEEVSELAIEHAEEDGRMTVREEDVRKAISQLPY